jgi:hypothetical protein
MTDSAGLARHAGSHPHRVEHFSIPETGALFDSRNRSTFRFPLTTLPSDEIDMRTLGISCTPHTA